MSEKQTETTRPTIVDKPGGSPKPEQIRDLSRSDLQGLVQTWTLQLYEKPEFAAAVAKAVQPQLAEIGRTVGEIARSQAELRAALVRTGPGGGGIVRRRDRDAENLDTDSGWSILEFDASTFTDLEGAERDSIPEEANQIAGEDDRGNLIAKRIRERQEAAERRRK